MIDTLCTVSTLNHQLTNLELAFSQRNYLPDGRVNETVATVEELNDLWKLGAMDGIPPFEMNCNCH